MAVDTKGLEDLDKFFQRLNSPKRDVITMSALHRYAETLKEATKQKLVAKMGDSATRPIVKKGKTLKPMVTGVKVTDDKDYAIVIVSILKQFLKFFEKGTQERFLKGSGAIDRTRKIGRKYARTAGTENRFKKGASRGRIEGIGFFKEAREEIDVNLLYQYLDEELDKFINES